MVIKVSDCDHFICQTCDIDQNQPIRWFGFVIDVQTQIYNITHIVALLYFVSQLWRHSFLEIHDIVDIYSVNTRDYSGLMRWLLIFPYPIHIRNGIFIAPFLHHHACSTMFAIPCLKHHTSSILKAFRMLQCCVCGLENIPFYELLGLHKSLASSHAHIHKSWKWD